MKQKLFYFFARSLWRSGLLKGVLFMFALSLLAAFILSDANIGQENKLFWDLLLIFEALWLHALTLLWAYELCKDEELLFLARLPLSTSLTRLAYERGKFFALIVAFLPLAVGIAALNAVVASPLVVWQSLLYAFSAILGGFLVLTLSRFVPSVSAILFSAAFLAVGNGLDELYLYATMQKDGGAVLKATSEIFYVVLPNFSLFDHQSEAIAGVLGNGKIDVFNATFSFWFLPPLYFAVLSLALFALAVWRFKRQAI
ncbi:MAG: hypothetical protein LBP89_05450 [Helicobacteraceae bacterium]|jgi:hypothetical protein|nr:hypothetical protein [Helicobacteraceae bacterium]